MEEELSKAAAKAWDSLARYKFMNFGYWAAIWVHLNHVSGLRLPSPFKDLVLFARGRKAKDGGTVFDGKKCEICICFGCPGGVDEETGKDLCACRSSGTYGQYVQMKCQDPEYKAKIAISENEQIAAEPR